MFKNIYFKTKIKFKLIFIHSITAEVTYEDKHIRSATRLGKCTRTVTVKMPTFSISTRDHKRSKSINKYINITSMYGE